MRFLLPLLLAAACTPLAGEWEGEVECDDDDDVDVEDLRRTFRLELEPEGDDEYDAKWELTASYEEYYEGQYYSVKEVYSGDGTVEADGSFGRQDLDQELDLTDCRAFVEGELVDEGECDAEDFLEEYDAEWDGANSIQFESKEYDCEGELERE